MVLSSKSVKIVLSLSAYWIIIVISLINTGFFPAYNLKHIFYHTGTLLYDENHFGDPEYLIRDDTGKVFIVTYLYSSDESKWDSKFPKGIPPEYHPFPEQGLRVRFSGDVLYEPTTMTYYIIVLFIYRVDSLNPYDFIFFSSLVAIPLTCSVALFFVNKGIKKR